MVFLYLSVVYQVSLQVEVDIPLSVDIYHEPWKNGRQSRRCYIIIPKNKHPEYQTGRAPSEPIFTTMIPAYLLGIQYSYSAMRRAAFAIFDELLD
jgi:hypothetical protein